MSIKDPISGNYVIDPLTRIEGHLRVELKVENGEVTDAWTSGTLYRGIETILKGREPIEAFYLTQRICGVCPVPNGHVSSQATEDALGHTIPNGARLVRNILEATQFMQSHIIWFYTLAALDYVDPAQALKANIADTYALAQAAGTSSAKFEVVQQKIKALIESGNHSIFTNGWFEHPAFSETMPPELHLIGVAHYLEAFEIQAEAARVMALIGGKFPHPMSSIPGGTTWVPTEEKLDDVLYKLRRVQEFIQNTLIPDTIAIGSHYKEALEYGKGCGNFLSWGVFEDESLSADTRYIPRGAVYADEGLVAKPVSQDDIKEQVASAWDDADPNKTLWDGETKPNYTEYDVNNKYTWCKSPRLAEKAMEVGPLARTMVAYTTPGERYDGIRANVDGALAALGAAGKPEVLVSLLGRLAARNLENVYLAQFAIDQVLELIEAMKSGNAATFKKIEKNEGEGGSLWEAPRGAISHWLRVDKGLIDNYNIIIPTTWNMGGKDDKGIKGPVEQALIGTPILDAERPLEAARVVRSFDPCIGCSIHAVEPKTGKKSVTYTNRWGVN